jgi:uncharacterized protein YdhG (YjbR/CyaY superfamily)
MLAQDIDSYLARLEEPGRSTLEALRKSIREVAPDAVEAMSYGAPALRKLIAARRAELK